MPFFTHGGSAPLPQTINQTQEDPKRIGGYFNKQYLQSNQQQNPQPQGNNYYQNGGQNITVVGTIV